MSNLNYARIRKSQKKSDCNIESKNLEISAPPEIHPSNPASLPVGERTPFPGPSVQIESSKLKNLFGENVVMDNLNYINDMLKSTLPDTVARPQRKKKGKEKVEEVPVHVPISSPEKASISIKIAEEEVKAPLNSVTVIGDQDSSLLDVGENNEVKKDNEEKLTLPKVEEVKSKLACERNMSSTLPAKDVEIFAGGFLTEENDSIKRSMSVEDIRIPNREQPKASGFGKPNYYIATEPESQGKELPEARVTLDSGPSRSSKSEFASNLDHYIDYFQKSDTVPYRTVKASQYFVNTGNRGSTGGHNHTNSIQAQIQSQRSGQAMNGEMEKMKSQIRKLKEKVHDLQLSNELLYKERKGWKRKNQELSLRAETAEENLTEASKKIKQYKEKLRYTEELLQREKLDNENNLLALKRVLANNISTVLEHRINHYMGTTREDSPKDKKSKNIWPDPKQYNSRGSNKEKEKKSASTYVHSSIHSANQGSAFGFEESHKIKSRNNRGLLHDKMSPLLSHKDVSFSDDEDLKVSPDKFGDLSQVEDLIEDFDDRGKVIRRRKQLSQFSMRPSDLDTSSEPTEELHIQNYASQQQNSHKIQQIQHLQNKLARLIEKDDSFSYSNSLCGPPVSQRNYDSAKSHRTKGHTISCFNQTSPKNNSWNTINLGRKVHEGTIPPTELHSQPSLHC